MTEMTKSEQDTLETALNDFKRSVEITRDVRFQANLRLANRQRLSAYMVSFLSLYIIALSLVPNIINVDKSQSQILLACSVVLSVFVIFTSLIEGSQNFYHQGELLHQCARKVATVHHKLKNIDFSVSFDLAKTELEGLQNEYQLALDNCPINHSNLDFAREKARKPHLFPVDYGKSWHRPKRQWFRLQGWLGPHLWMSLHVTAVTIISFVVYYFVLYGASPVK